MKILYGVQGTGNGHIARARAMSKAFESHDVQVDFLFLDEHRRNTFQWKRLAIIRLVAVLRL